MHCTSQTTTCRQSLQPCKAGDDAYVSQLGVVQSSALNKTAEGVPAQIMSLAACKKLHWSHLLWSGLQYNTGF